MRQLRMEIKFWDKLFSLFYLYKKQITSQREININREQQTIFSYIYNRNNFKRVVIYGLPNKILIYITFLMHT